MSKVFKIVQTMAMDVDKFIERLRVFIDESEWTVSSLSLSAGMDNSTIRGWLNPDKPGKPTATSIQ